ncbi:hypothetical protein NLG97_g5761 [Lecanicillium saksenae]|uniref:Uncharacterized protein n=1 Tax=Lecanicillium saksenae TaxID=468837 RepID=A0ACC1QSX1_9HYPO|nr:hypothetical protein NLG97_g5761 [Lecanicillium saksenae]
MGNVPSSEEVESNPHHRWSSKQQETIDWVHIAGENDYDGVPTTPVIGAPHQLQDAIPTVPSFAYLQSQSFSGKRLPKNSLVFGQDPSVATGYYDESRPSRHSTDAARPMGRVSGSARAASLEEEDAEFRNDAENKRLEGLHAVSTPGLSSSSSTGSARTISSDSNTSRELPLYIPYRRRSLQRIPGQATRPEKAESGIDKTPGRPKLPPLKTYIPYSPSVQAENNPDPLPATLAQEEDFDEQEEPSEVAYQQLGSIKFGSLRITNGSPLSMRRGGANASEVSDNYEDKMDNPPASVNDYANSHRILPPDSRHARDPNDSNFTEEFYPATLNSHPRELPDNMFPGQPVRGRQWRASIEDTRLSGGRAYGRIPLYGERNNRMSSDTQNTSRMPSVIDDEQLKLVRRRRSTRMTADDASSTYSLPNEQNIPIIFSDDIVQNRNTNSDSSNGPHLSFQSFRNLIRQNRVKSYLEANSKATAAQKNSHQRSVSEQEPTSARRSRSTSKPRRRLTKKNPKAAAPPVPGLSGSGMQDYDATAEALQRPQTAYDQISRQDVKGHSWSKSDGAVPRMQSSTYSGNSVPPIPQQVERSLRNHTENYPPMSERVPIMLDSSHPAPRARVSFEELPREAYPPAARAQQIRRSKTVEFKPLPTPNPELPPKRTPVRVPMPTPTGVGNTNGNRGLRDPRNRQWMHPPMPTHTRSNTVTVNQYRPSRDASHQDRDYQDRNYPERNYQDDDEIHRDSPDHDSPYVSPLSDDDQDLWPITTHEASSQTMQKRSSTFQPREVSPLRHAKSLPSIRNSRERQLRTPAPISAHSRRAQGVAAWQQQQQRQLQHRQKQHHPIPQQPPMPRKQPPMPPPPPPPPPPMPQQQPPMPQQSGVTADQTGFSAFYEDCPSYYPATADMTDEKGMSSLLPFETARDSRESNPPPVVYRNGPRRGAEVASSTWKPPYRILHSYYSPAYRNAPIWG